MLDVVTVGYTNAVVGVVLDVFAFGYACVSAGVFAVEESLRLDHNPVQAIEFVAAWGVARRPVVSEGVRERWPGHVSRSVQSDIMIDEEKNYNGDDKQNKNDPDDF